MLQPGKELVRPLAWVELCERLPYRAVLDRRDRGGEGKQ